jgi:hypothetical protein
VVPDPSQPKAEVTVSVLGGDGGGVLANINRWRRQLNLDPVEQATLWQVVRSLAVPGRNGVLVDMSGQNTNGQPTRILGAILPQQDQIWFYKMMGDPATVQQQTNAFVQFVQTAKYGN